MSESKISYTLGFVIFWGFGLSISLAVGGLLAFAIVALVLLMLVHYEHAHARVCEINDIPVRKITFGAFGAAVDADLPNTSEAVDVYLAGVKNSAAYSAVAIALLFSVTILGWWYSWNFADSSAGGLLYWMQFIHSFVLASGSLVLTNVLPISWYSKTYKQTVMTDGMATIAHREICHELWNDGKIAAVCVR